MNNRWDNSYTRNQHIFGLEPNPFIKLICERINFAGPSLTIAEAEGRNALYITQQAKEKEIPFSMDMWDISSVGLKTAQQRAKTENLTINTSCIDLDQVQWQPDSYQNVFCVYGHFPFALRQKTLQGVRYTLKNGGWFIGEVFSKSQSSYSSGGPRMPETLYDPQEFLDIFKQDHFHHFFVGDVERHEGNIHHGVTHAIQFAIKIKK